jgi:hypothetical protein
VSDGKASFAVSSLSPGAVFAQTQLALVSSDSDGSIYTGGRITLTPNITGGTWTYDSAYISLSDNTFTAKKRGSTTVTYTVGEQSASYIITIRALDLPSAGQDSLVGCFGGAALLYWRQRRLTDYSDKTRLGGFIGNMPVDRATKTRLLSAANIVADAA